MVRPTSRAGAGQDLVSTVLIPSAISDTQGWCGVMAYIQSALVGPVVLGRGRSPRHNRHRSGAGSDLGDAAVFRLRRAEHRSRQRSVRTDAGNCSDLRGSPAFPTGSGRVAKHRIGFANRSRHLKREQLPTLP